MRNRDLASEVDKRLRFAAEYAKLGVGTEAAKAVGVSEKQAKVQAHRWLKREDVQAEIQRVRVAAVAQVELRSRGPIADLARALERATAVLEVNAVGCYGQNGELDMGKVHALPEGQQAALQVESQHTTDAEGQAFSRYKIKRDPTALAAAKLLVDHYTNLETPKQPGVNIAVLNLPPETLKKVASALLGQEVIETTAKVVE